MVAELDSGFHGGRGTPLVRPLEGEIRLPLFVVFLSLSLRRHLPELGFPVTQKTAEAEVKRVEAKLGAAAVFPWRNQALVLPRGNLAQLAMVGARRRCGEWLSHPVSRRPLLLRTTGEVQMPQPEEVSTVDLLEHGQPRSLLVPLPNGQCKHLCFHNVLAVLGVFV